MTGLHRKSAATNNLLHFSSFHSKHLRKGIPKGQFLRIRRNCSDEKDFKETAANLTDRFCTRGYHLLQIFPCMILFCGLAASDTSERTLTQGFLALKT